MRYIGIMNRLLVSVKKQVKRFVSYTIENDRKIFCLKDTDLKISFPLESRYIKKLEKCEIIPNKIVFDNYMGKSYGGNCKYVTEELLRRKLKIDIVWIVKDIKKHRKEFPKNIRLVEYLSKEAFYEYFSAGIWVCNYHLIAYFNKGLKKRKNQKYIQLWHGSLGIKKIEKNCTFLAENQSWTYLARKNSENTDYWISNSKFETEIYKSAFWNPRIILEYGHPRNDIFFKKTELLLKNKVKNSIFLRKDEKYVLYVPTYREEMNLLPFTIDTDKIVESLKKRFGGEWRFVIRKHPRMQDDIEQQEVIDASNYPDIQELLMCADALITDYSSCIFDFIFSYKPAFIYAPDKEKYNRDRGLYYPLEETPFPVSSSINDLMKEILNFNEQAYIKKAKVFLAEKGCIEDGFASFRVCELIEEILLGDIEGYD